MLERIKYLPGNISSRPLRISTPGLRDTTLFTAGAGSAATDEIKMLEAAAMRTETFMLEIESTIFFWKEARSVDVLEACKGY